MKLLPEGYLHTNLYGLPLFQQLCTSSNYSKAFLQLKLIEITQMMDDNDKTFLSNFQEDTKSAVSKNILF